VDDQVTDQKGVHLGEWEPTCELATFQRHNADNGVLRQRWRRIVTNNHLFVGYEYQWRSIPDGGYLNE
jgi:hypothetical protein